MCVKVEKHPPSLFMLSPSFALLEVVGGAAGDGGEYVLSFERALVSVTCGTTSAMIVT
jgi:hypothetical protein